MADAESNNRFPTDEVITQAVTREEISDELDAAEIVALKDADQRKALIDRALEIKDKDSAKHLAAELKSAREAYVARAEADPAATAALADVEKAIDEHVATLDAPAVAKAKAEELAKSAPATAAEATGMLGQFGEYLKPVQEAFEYVTKNLSTWMKPLQDAFGVVKDYIAKAFAAAGPQLAGTLKMFGVQIPEFLMPDPKSFVALKEGLKKNGIEDVTLTGEEDRDGLLKHIDGLYREIVATGDAPLPLPEFHKELAAEAKVIEPGTAAVSLVTVDTAAIRVKAKRSKALPPEVAPAKKDA